MGDIGCLLGELGKIPTWLYRPMRASATLVGSDQLSVGCRLLPISNLAKENKMAVYRITRFSSSDMDKAMELAESVRASMADIKFDFIDVAQDDQGRPQTTHILILQTGHL